MPNSEDPFINLSSKELITQHAYFLNIINNVPGAVLRFELFPDDSHRFIYLSEQAEKLWGINNADALKDSSLLWNQILEEDAFEFKRTLVQSAKLNTVWNHQWRIKNTEGKIKWLKGTGTPLKLKKSLVWDTLILDITDQKKKEEELAKKTAILERTEKLAKIGSWEVDPKTLEVYWSEEIFRIFKFPLSDKTPPLEEQYKMLTKESIEAIHRVSEEALKNKSNFECELQIIQKNEQNTYALIKGFYNFNSDGVPTIIYGSIQDITERKQIEKELQKSEEMFKNIADNIPGLIIRYVENENNEEVQFVSKGYKDLFEISEEQAYTSLEFFRERIHPDDTDKYIESMKEASESRSHWNQEFRLLMPDGRIKWIQGRGQPQEITENSLQWDIMILDISENKAATDHIRSLKDQLDLAIQTADLGVWKVDFIHKDMIWNDEVLRIYGITRKQFNKNKAGWKDLVHPEDWPSVKQAAVEAGKGNNSIRIAFRVIQPSGEIRHVLASASPFYQNNKITGIIGINLDVTQFKEIEQDLLKAKLLAEKNEQAVIAKNEELKKANQELDNFVYRVSHDLRSPITSAIGLSQISLRSENVEEIHQYDELRIKTLEKLDSFISEILNYSRNSRLPVASEAIDFKEIISKILEDHQGVIQTKSIKIETNIQQNGEFKGDRMRIVTIFENLLSNALKFINPFNSQHCISISIHVTEKMSKVEIADNGIGIKKERQPKIYEMFYRGTDQHNGSGIGLYILYECLNKIQGSISLKSKEGKGTTFYLELPSTKK